jgi:hypothetical protein
MGNSRVCAKGDLLEQQENCKARRKEINSQKEKKIL